MNRNFLKTNWFYVALGLLLLVYTVRKYPALNPFIGSGKAGSIEKTTEGKGGKKSGAALLGFVPDRTAKEEEIASVDATKAEVFLKRFAPVVLSERKKFRIPASVMLACAYVNSQAGQKTLAQEGNNFFALPCDDSWDAETIQHKGTCYRKYESAWASFRDFSIYLSSQEWYGALKKSAGMDADPWIEKLGKEGVSNAKELQKVIEAYDLIELDGI